MSDFALIREALQHPSGGWYHDAMQAVDRVERNAAAIDRLLLVIESATRNADPSQHSAVLAALQANQAALAKVRG